jgi:hypothetical protein
MQAKLALYLAIAAHVHLPDYEGNMFRERALPCTGICRHARAI